MDTLLFFQTIAFLLFGAALTMFVVLDGFDLGLGMVNPFWTKNPQAQVAAMHSIWPVWDGNEIWGILAAGALLSAFPPVFGLVLTAFYPYAVLLVIAIMYRPVAFELWHYNTASRRLWRSVFALCSFLIPVLIGAVLGNALVGMRLVDGRFVGGLLELLNPFALLTGVGFATVCLLHGVLWLRVKMGEEHHAELEQTFRRVWLTHFVVAVAWLVFLFVGLPDAGKPLVIVGAVVLLADLVLIRVLYGKRDKLLFALSTLGILSIWLIIAAYQYPRLIRGSAGSDITVMDASSPLPTLQFIGIAAPLALLVVAAYSVYVYRVFKGRVKAGSVGY